MYFKYDKFEVRLLDKENDQELKIIQSLRYEYLLRDFNPSLPPNGYDDDGYDPQADSIIVIDTEINKIVGTYRIETLKTVNGRKFKDEREFNIDALKNCGYEILELGRAVVDTKYRNGVVIQLLWSGIWKYAIENNCRYIFGTCSLHGSDPSIYANLLCYLKKELLTDIDVYAIKSPFNYDYIDEYDIEKLKDEIPNLLKGYIKMGAKVSKTGFADPVFNSCDIITILDLENCNKKYMERISKFVR